MSWYFFIIIIIIILFWHRSAFAEDPSLAMVVLT